MHACRGRLVRWTKGFALSNGVGGNPVEYLSAALTARGWLGDVVALLNDGVGIFGAGRYQDPDVAVSVILGTGACCRMRMHAQRP
jgi:hexokinase